MASAEKLLHEAQFAFQSISFGESPENKRNASRAKSLCLKIIRKHPTSMEASEAHAILRRLGEEAYSSKMGTQHQHQPQSVHHSKPRPLSRSVASTDMQNPTAVGRGTETLNWSGLLELLFAMPKIVLAALVLAGFLLFGVLGGFIFLPLILFVLFTGPFRQTLKQEQRDQVNALIVKVNEYIAERRGGTR
jgi:hypothetical protein